MYLGHHWEKSVLIDEGNHQLIYFDQLKVEYKNVLRDYEQSEHCSGNFRLVLFLNKYILNEVFIR